jgi:hypothetical protein
MGPFPDPLLKALAQAEEHVKSKELMMAREAISPVLDYLVEKKMDVPERVQRLYAGILMLEKEILEKRS